MLSISKGCAVHNILQIFLFFSVKNIFFFQAMEQGAIKRNNNAEV